MSGPVFIDNLDGNTLKRALQEVLTGEHPGRDGQESRSQPTHLDIASAFFSPAGFAQIAGHLSGIEGVRLLIGAEPPVEAKPPPRQVGETQAEYERRLLKQGLKDLDEGMRAERDRFPFTRAGRESLRKLIEVLRSGRMEARRYDRAFMHAKAYIFPSQPDNGGGVIVGSSNLTRAGVVTNLELNVGHYDDPVVAQAQAWFQRLWEEASPVDLTEMLEEVFAEYTPFQIFLRILYQLYGSEVEALAVQDEGLPLTSFQKHGAARALRLIEENGGAIVADEVGLGKTFIAGEIMKLYLDRRQRCLLVCPAQLRDSTWRRFRAAQFLNDVECLSYEELAIDQQIAMAEPDQYQEKLARPLKEYQLIVIDEAHNYRNPNTPSRAAVLRKLLWGQRRDVLLLTATPVNNSLWDLFHLVRYYQRQDAFLADRGILSVEERFKHAARVNPADLSPDVLYPIIDATTVKRTRQFVKKHYGGDQIKLPDGTTAPIIFPAPQAVTVRYALSDPLPALFDLIEEALNGSEPLSFARYTPQSFLKTDAPSDPDDAHQAASAVGLLMSGLLKRFESSAHAFCNTLDKLIREHEIFLAALDQGRVVNTKFMHEVDASDDEAFNELLAASEESADVGDYDQPKLRAAVTKDLRTLKMLRQTAGAIGPDEDPKLKALVSALEAIAQQAETEAVDDDDARQKRKVIVFSFFADTVAYLREQLTAIIARTPSLAAYRGRIVAVAGSEHVEPDEVSRAQAVSGFAPISTESTDSTDRFDILIATDVLAEGVNLQQCRHIVNYDVPWNPMRLVQRHGRVDRIGSRHTRVFLRTIFPADRLDQLLNLEQRILNKIAMAAASIGVTSPVAGGAVGRQVFSESREEIEKLLREDPGLFERGLSGGAGQTGEEYRQTLRRALEQNARFTRIPRGAGSGMVKGSAQGVLFCAAIGKRTYLRFMPCTEDWVAASDSPPIHELGTCLRLIECDEATPRHVPAAAEIAVFDLWQTARQHIWDAWMLETDPANLQPKVRPLNKRVAEFIRANRPPEDDAHRVNAALDILEAPWPRREEILLREWFAEAESDNVAKARKLVHRILESGLEPFNQPPLLPPIELDEVELICWLAIAPNTHP